MKFVASAILIAFVAAQEEEVERVPLIDASTILYFIENIDFLDFYSHLGLIYF